jgi:tellurite resistance protein
MVLDPRLKKLAGVSARKAAGAYVKSHSEAAGLTDLERGQAEEFEATLEAMFLMAAVDGDISEEELGQLRTSIAAVADLGALEATGLDRLLGEFGSRLERDGWKARLTDVARRIPTDDGRQFAFRLAAGVAMVDDSVENAEAAAIEAFAAALQISPEDSQALLREVLDEIFGSEA